MHSVGFEMPRALCIVLVQPRLRALFHAHTSSLSLIAQVGGIVSFLFLGGACSFFCSLGWAVTAGRLAGAGQVDCLQQWCYWR